MAVSEWRNADGEREGPNERPSERSGDVGELERIVQVAEELRMDPEIVRVALEHADGAVRTDVSLWDSIRIVERALNREERTPRAVGTRR